jgi:uncharacterized membrane protein YhaH (DUF805 family)
MSDAWFYTRQGEQLGPLSFPELQEKARAGELNPRLDMAWTQGMAEWKPAGEIEDLFEKRAPAEAPETLAPAAGPYEPPRQDEAAEMLSPEGGWPGARRRSFYLMTILFPILWAIGFGAATPLLQKQFGNDIMGVATIGAMFVPWIVAIAYGLKRLVNLGMSRWWYLGNFVPILNLWVTYRMYVCPAGYAYNKKLDGAGVALAILYWLMILLSVLMVASAIALMAGAVGSPEMRQQLQEALQDVREAN